MSGSFSFHGVAAELSASMRAAAENCPSRPPVDVYKYAKLEVGDGRVLVWTANDHLQERAVVSAQSASGDGSLVTDPGRLAALLGSFGRESVEVRYQRGFLELVTERSHVQLSPRGDASDFPAFVEVKPSKNPASTDTVAPDLQRLSQALSWCVPFAHESATSEKLWSVCVGGEGWALASDQAVIGMFQGVGPCPEMLLTLPAARRLAKILGQGAPWVTVCPESERVGASTDTNAISGKLIPHAPPHRGLYTVLCQLLNDPPWRALLMGQDLKDALDRLTVVSLGRDDRVDVEFADGQLRLELKSDHGTSAEETVPLKSLTARASGSFILHRLAMVASRAAVGETELLSQTPDPESGMRHAMMFRSMRSDRRSRSAGVMPSFYTNRET